MTKAVRIENADNGPYQLTVQVWDKGRDQLPDTLVKTVELSYPTCMATEYITDTRYLVVKEAPAS